MKYELKPQADGTHVLTGNGKNLTCPIKASFPQQIPVSKEVLAINPDARPQMVFIGQTCGTFCPLFEIFPQIDENVSVKLHCGNSRLIEDVEITQVPEASKA